MQLSLILATFPPPCVLRALDHAEEADHARVALGATKAAWAIITREYPARLPAVQDRLDDIRRERGVRRVEFNRRKMAFSPTKVENPLDKVA